jgi:hypothetical protein
MSTEDPRATPDEAEPGVPVTSEVRRDQWLSGTEDEADPAPLDHPQGVDEWGTTAREEELGESLEMRQRREVPDRPERPDPYLSRSLVDPVVGDAGGIDDEPDLVAELDDSPEDTLSAEEAAVRVVDDPPGANYDDDPGYLDTHEP